VLTETWPTNSSDISTGQDNAWTEDSGAGGLQVTSNALQNTSASAAGRAPYMHTDFSSEAHSHEATAALGTNSNLAGVYNRCSTTFTFNHTADCYGGEGFRETGFNIRRAVEFNSGTRTTKSSDSTDPGASLTISISSDSSDSHDVVVGGFSHTFSDATHSNLKCGVFLSAENTAGNATLDSHTMQDVAAATTRRYSLTTLGVG